MKNNIKIYLFILFLISSIDLYAIHTKKPITENAELKSIPILLKRVDSFQKNNILLSKKLYDLGKNQDSFAKQLDLLEIKYHESEVTIISHLHKASLIVEYLALILTLFSLIAGAAHLILFKNERKELKLKLLELKEFTDKQKNYIDLKLENIKIIYDKLFLIDKQITGTQTFIQKGHENLFDLLQYYADKNQLKNLMEIIFRKRAICSLYSHEENERFTGISVLTEKGLISDIDHLEYIILNPDENENNKRLAIDAITNIRLRSNIGSIQTPNASTPTPSNPPSPQPSFPPTSASVSLEIPKPEKQSNSESSPDNQSIDPNNSDLNK